MTSTLNRTRRGVYRKSASIPVTDTEVRDFGRILSCFGRGHEWNAPQPQALAYLRENVSRGKSAVPMRAYLMLLWNGCEQRLADFVGAKRREKLGQSRARDIQALILEETAAECDANPLEARVLAGKADRHEQAELGEKLRTHAFKALALADALADAVHATEVRA